MVATIAWPGMLDGGTLTWSSLGATPNEGTYAIHLPLWELSSPHAPFGRSGSLLVVQLRSSIRLQADRRATLKSLGLKGVDTASLRFADEVTLGYIAKVRDIVGVIDLGGVFYRQTEYNAGDSSLSIDCVEHGTNSRPGATVRSSDGEYFSYDSDRRGILVDVSSTWKLLDVLNEIDSAFPDARPLAKDDASMLAIAGEGSLPGEFDELEGITSWDGAWHETPVSQSGLIVEMPTDEAISLIRSHRIGIAAARIAFHDFFVTWQEPYSRFVNSDRELSEVGVYVRSPKQLAGLSRLIRAVSKPGFIDNARPRIIMREHGNAKHYTI